MATPRLHDPKTAVLVVDMQEKLLPHMHNHQRLTEQVTRLLQGANALGLAVLFTEQHPKGLGHTVAPLAELLSGAVCRHEKLKFSACTQPIREALARRGIRSVVVCGVEAHVCVLHTCLDLADNGFLAAVAVDAIGSRRPIDQDTAVTRMVQANILPTTVESSLLEFVQEAGSERFKAVLPILRLPPPPAPTTTKEDSSN